MLRVENLRKVYRTGRSELVVFDNLSFTVAPGEMLAIVGASGSGKSTLLHVLGALDAASAGEVYCAGTHINALSADGAAEFRNRTIGYVWQFHYLLPEFSAAENVAMPLLARRNGNGVDPDSAMQQAQAWLKRVGLAERSHHRAGELSGGEQQRVAVARALITEPKVLFADEPTGDLDGATADEIFALIHDLHVEKGLTSLIVTHNNGFARRCQRVLKICGGRVEEVAPEALPA